MSTEEIIHAWKHNEDDAEKQSKREPPSIGEGEKKRRGKVPSNPAGEQELRDEDLKAVEGGMVPGTFTVYPSSCYTYSC